MNIRVLMITYNRPHYLRISLPRLCETLPEEGKIVIWDNASKTETRDYLRAFEGHPRVDTIHFSDSNRRLREPTNWFWQNYGEADFVSKVDDDCLMPRGWCETLVQAHHDIPNLGVVGCWRFYPEDFVPELARRKIQAFGSHQLMRNCWVEGSGYLMKRAMRDQLGSLGDTESFAGYCIRGALLGFVNGWYYPFLYQDHFDDPRSPHSAYTTEEAFRAHRPLSADTFDIQTLEEWKQRLRDSARRLQMYSFNPRAFSGPTYWLGQRLARLFRREYIPRAR